MSTYIVTVTAADRVGIVYSVAGTLRDQGGNILELSQTVMRGLLHDHPGRRVPRPHATRGSSPRRSPSGASGST